VADLERPPIAAAPRKKPPATRNSVSPFYAAAAAALVAGSAWTSAFSPRPVLLWNASPSSRIGLYWVDAERPPGDGETAIAWAPEPARRLAAARGYLPANVPLVKRVAAAAGDRVCARNRVVFVNGRRVALRRRSDPSGRRLPWWSGCTLLKPGDVFLLSAAPTAFDGRYFGITHARQLIGSARLIWAA
jgi:conjugative transfer signal peptidase TraF